MEADIEVPEATALRLLAVSAFRYYLATLEADSASRVAKQGAQLQSPRPGDWVMEISTIWDARSDFDRIGRLILARDEVVSSADEPWAAFNDDVESAIHERFTYIERLDGTVFCWHNCEFIRLFEDIRSDEEIAAMTQPDDADTWRSTWLASARQRHKL
jgi:hypothetical protein